MKQGTVWYLNTRLILGIVAILMVTGLAGWLCAYEQEDPHFPYRNGFITVSSAGMSPQQLVDTYIKPIERILSQVDEIHDHSARIKVGSAVIDVELNESEYDTDRVWQRIKERLAPIQKRSSDAHITIQDRAQDTQGIVLSVNSGRGLLFDRQLAIEVRNELLLIGSLRSVELLGDPGQQLVVNYSQEMMLETGVSPLQIAQRLTQAQGQSTQAKLTENITGLGLASLNRLANEQLIGEKQINTPQGTSIPLSSIAQLAHTTDSRVIEQFWINGRQVVGLAITLPPNKVDVEQVGEQVKVAVANINARFLDNPVQIEFFQPDWSTKRRNGLLYSLLLSSLGVAVVLLCLMSIRSAVIVSLSIPTIALSVIALFTSFDGVIHQMTIAGMVLSLGLMVDNCIVVSERMTYFVEQGLTKLDAAMNAVKELSKPLACATMTTVAAFVPMLLAKGSVADFIATIPLIVILGIGLSYIVALTFVPVTFQKLDIEVKWLTQLQMMFRRTMEGCGGYIANVSVNHPKRVAVGSILFVVGLMSIESTPGEFFPKTNRDQAYVDIQLPFGSHIAKTSQVAFDIAALIERRDDVHKAWVFAGFSGPRFYYNLVQQPSESHIARVVFQSTDKVNMRRLVSELNQILKARHGDIIVNARELGQGPPIESPLELRVFGDDLNRQQAAAEEMLSQLRAVEGLENLRRGYTFGNPQLSFQFDETMLGELSVNEQMLSDYLAWRSSGMVVTNVDFLQEPTELVIRDYSSDQSSESLLNTHVVTASQQIVPISAFASASIIGHRAYTERRNGQTVLTIKSDVAQSYDEEAILEAILPSLYATAGQYGVSLKLGGEIAETQEANNALFKTLPAGVALLFIALIIQFNSVRLSLLVMLSIPLGVIGAPAMLAMVGVPFGFMSILGVLALTGIVVNSAILLIESALQQIENGVEKHIAVKVAVQNRIRPVIVTTVTTIVGMLPLTSSASPLWPPLAWAVIGGLISSTLLMLIVMPALMVRLLKVETSQEELQHV